jgi:ribonuclease HI
MQEHLLNQIRSPLNLITTKFYVSPSTACKLINATVMAMIGYRMQVILFDLHWLDKIEALVNASLNKRTRLYPRAHAMWSLAFNLKPLQLLNYERYLGSIWRTMQIPPPSNSVANLVILLNRPPNPIPHNRKQQWIEPQDVIGSANLHCFHKELHPQPSLSLFKQPQPVHLPPNPEEKENTIVAIDGSLQATNNVFHMSASVVNSNKDAIGWAVHGPPSSTEAELQAIIGAIVSHPKATTINIVTDSQAAINLAIHASYHRHTNLHNLANRVSLRTLNHLTQGKVIKEVDRPTSSNSPTIHLIHILSHSDQDTVRQTKNRNKLLHLTDKLTEMNNRADEMAKASCTAPNTGHHPFLIHNDSLLIYSPMQPQEHYSVTLSQTHTTILKEQFSAAEPKKASRWFNKHIDLIATVAPLRNSKKNIETFTLKLLLSSLPTKPTIRRSKWYKTLPDNHPKKHTYSNDNCPHCDTRESHKHIFDECTQSNKFKEEFKKDTIALVNHHTQKTLTSLPWWFTTGERDTSLEHKEALVECRKDLGWRGFIPNALYNTLILYTSPTKADSLCKLIANNYAECNFNIWKNRCDKLHGRT